MARLTRHATTLEVLLVLAALCTRSGAGAEVTRNGRTFRLPEGFTLELAAAPPLIDRPIVADFDEQGRLYVADSSGSSAPVEAQLRDRPHRIVRLEDTDGDGRFDRRVVFADRMMFPEGAMWHDGSLYVSAPPSIWKLTDTDGDGVADRRVEWYLGKTLTGCANDLHGPYLGPDGWIYWCKGAFARQVHERPGRPPLETRAAHVFRARPDGSGREAVMTGGMDNPVDVAFTPGGERILTATFLQHPGGGRRDGLIHAIYGGVYGKVHEVIDDHPRTAADVMPVLDHLGPAAPCGLTRYESDVFGASYRDSLFATLFNLRKVTRHVLEPSGATFVTRDEDFLTSDALDFHPTDVLEDADGSLLVIDTGGWYKLCCPTSQIGKPDVLGAIYRIRRRGAKGPDDPRGLALPWARVTAEELAARLDDPRPAVRRRAGETLARRGNDALPALERRLGAASSPEARRQAVWTLARIEGSGASDLLRRALADPDATVRQAAIHSASVRRDRGAVPVLVELLKGPSPQNRRAAAEALGRIGDARVVPDLLDAASLPGDRVLEHSLTFALIEIGDAPAIAAGLKHPAAEARRNALVALDQLGKGALTDRDLEPALASADPTLRRAADWILGHHPEWTERLAGTLRARLDAEGLSDAERAALETQLARLARSPAVQTILADRLSDPEAPELARRSALRAMAEARLPQLPEPWTDAILTSLAQPDGPLVRLALAVLRNTPPAQGRAQSVSKSLRDVAGNRRLAPEVRFAALALIPNGPGELSATQFDELCAALAPDRPLGVRSAAVDVLARARLSRAQLLSLAPTLEHTGPLETERLLDAFGGSPDEEVGRRLVASLQGSAALPSLRPETLRPRIEKFGPAVRDAARPLFRALEVDTSGQRARLEAALGALGPGDVRRGQAVFNGGKAACASCHAIGYLGGTAGPDLTRVGQVRSERDLLESILFPSASFVRSFEPVVVATRDGKLYNGLVRRETPEEVVLTTGPEREERLPRSEIEEIRPSAVSLMPAGLDQQLSRAELADLIAFLRACR